MTQQQIPPYAGHSAGFFWGQLSQDQKETVLKNVAEQAAKTFALKVQAYKDASGLRKPGPAERLAMYRTRLPERWAMLQAGLPKVYRAQIGDWRQLEEKGAEDEETGPSEDVGSTDRAPADASISTW